MSMPRKVTGSPSARSRPTSRWSRALLRALGTVPLFEPAPGGGWQPIPKEI